MKLALLITGLCLGLIATVFLIYNIVKTIKENKLNAKNNFVEASNTSTLKKFIKPFTIWLYIVFAFTTLLITLLCMFTLIAHSY